MRGSLRTEWAVALVAALAGAACALVLSQLALVQLADRRLDDYADRLLAYSLDVAQTSRRVLAEIDAADREPCSDADLTELRHLTFQVDHLADVGRLDEDGAIACTAMWGRLRDPITLPPPQRVQHEGDKLWANVPHVGPLRLNVDMAGRGSAIVFTSPLAFRAFRARHDDIRARVLTEDGRHVYRTFGDPRGLGRPADHPPAAWHDIGSSRAVAECSSEVDICVVAALDELSVFRLPPLLTLGLAFLGFLSGGGLGMAVYLRRVKGLPLTERIKRAIADGRLTVVYQPLVRVSDGRVIGFEALARLDDESGEAIPPDVFIGLAEEHGFIGQITRAVIRTTLTEMRDELLARDDFYCAINLSVADITDPALCEFLNEEVARHGLDPRRIVLEITERSTTGHEELIAGIARFREQGQEFYIDDFGTGQSSLSYVARLPINGIKLDRMFTQAIGKEAVSSAIVENVSTMAMKLDLRLVVEGIETREQAQYVKEINPMATGQGWLYGRPMAAGAFVAATRGGHVESA